MSTPSRDQYGFSGQLTPFEPLAAPRIDDRSSRELVRLALNWAYRASRGQLNDFSAASPIVVLTEALAFVGSEIQFKANKVAETAAVQLLQTAGVQRKLGFPARVQLRFELGQTLTSVFVIPKGFKVFSRRNLRIGNRNRPVYFQTDRELTIPAGAFYGVVSATCTELGKVGNLPANTLTEYSSPLNYLRRVYNPSAASGGQEPETLDQTKQRGFFALNRRGFFSKRDFVQGALDVIGRNASVILEKNVGKNGARQDYAIHLYVLDSDGLPINATMLAELEAYLRKDAPIHLDELIYVSNRPFWGVHLLVDATLKSGVSAPAVSNTIKSRIERYFHPNRFVNRPVLLTNELEYQVRRASGVDFVSGVLFSESGDRDSFVGVNFTLPAPRYAPLLSGLRINLLQGSRTFNYSYGK